mmetsp:Transcript_39994/g.123581  ORF Transcript_39994/g.123581 Transcript_39994/m.123581 type:complete len:233 (-) Transcript_39994:1157-1855(-)
MREPGRPPAGTAPRPAGASTKIGNVSACPVSVRNAVPAEAFVSCALVTVTLGRDAREWPAGEGDRPGPPSAEAPASPCAPTSPSAVVTVGSSRWGIGMDGGCVAGVSPGDAEMALCVKVVLAGVCPPPVVMVPLISSSSSSSLVASVRSVASSSARESAGVNEPSIGVPVCPPAVEMTGMDGERRTSREGRRLPRRAESPLDAPSPPLACIDGCAVRCRWDCCDPRRPPRLD